jgi:hypothetical protein
MEPEKDTLTSDQILLENILHEQIAIHRNYFDYLKRRNQGRRSLDHKIGAFFWFITVESKTRDEILEKLGEMFPAWKGYRGVSNE